MFASYHDSMNPDRRTSATTSAYYWDLDTEEWVEDYRIVHRRPTTMDPDIKHPYMTQWTVGIERELFKDTSLSVTYINRKWNNIIGPLRHAAADYTVVPVDVLGSRPDLRRLRADRGDATRSAIYLITNIETRRDPWVLLDPYRKYGGIEVLFNKRFSNRWQLLASYVYGHATGTHRQRLRPTTSATAGAIVRSQLLDQRRGEL